MELTEKEKRDIIAVVVKISVEKMFETHLYSFAGKTYRQSGGGPIGLGITCAVARVCMSAWDKEWLERTGVANLIFEAAMRYMDDGRCVLYPVRPGWRWTSDWNIA